MSGLKVIIIGEHQSLSAVKGELKSIGSRRTKVWIGRPKAYIGRHVA